MEGGIEGGNGEEGIDGVRGGVEGGTDGGGEKGGKLEQHTVKRAVFSEQCRPHLKCRHVPGVGFAARGYDSV